METAQGNPPPGGERRTTPAAPVNGRARPLRSKARPVPFLRLLLFYIVVVGAAAALIHYVPLVRHAWMSAPVGDGGKNSLSKSDLVSVWQDRGMIERLASVFLISLGAMMLALPVAWVYTFTRRLRYDPSLVHSVIILPLVVAGVVVIVKDSVALAFSLAGIVGIVRFRNTLKDPKDTVYIFLALGIGLAAGVQALDIALVLSFMFNFVVLILWKYNLASMYGESDNDLLSIGNRKMMIARNPWQRDAIRWRMSKEASDMDTDGLLLVHTHDPDSAKQRLELTLPKAAEDWRYSEGFRKRDGIETFAIMLKLKDKKGDPLTILEEVDERWGAEVTAAEYVPFRRDAEKKKKKKDDDD